MIDDAIADMMTLIDDRIILVLKLGSDEARSSPMGATVSAAIAATVDEFVSRGAVTKVVTSEVEQAILSSDVVTAMAKDLFGTTI